MLAVQGYFKAGRFVSSETTKIPEHRPVIVVIANEERPGNAEAWQKFLSALRSIDEESPSEFERASLQREVKL